MVHTLCRACYGVLRFVMESGAKGCEVIVSGKLRAARAKSMKFKDGYMVSSKLRMHMAAERLSLHSTLQLCLPRLAVVAPTHLVADVRLPRSA